MGGKPSKGTRRDKRLKGNKKGRPKKGTTRDWPSPKRAKHPPPKLP